MCVLFVIKGVQKNSAMNKTPQKQFLATEISTLVTPQPSKMFEYQQVSFSITPSASCSFPCSRPQLTGTILEHSTY